MFIFEAIFLHILISQRGNPEDLKSAQIINTSQTPVSN